MLGPWVSGLRSQVSAPVSFTLTRGKSEKMRFLAACKLR